MLPLGPPWGYGPLALVLSEVLLGERGTRVEAGPEIVDGDSGVPGLA